MVSSNPGDNEFEHDCSEGLNTDDSFLITTKTCKGIFWKHDIRTVNSDKLSALLHNFGVTNFQDFLLPFLTFLIEKEKLIKKYLNV